MLIEKKQGAEACLVCYHLYGKVYALEMSRQIHRKLLTRVSSSEETASLEWRNHFSFQTL